MLKCFGPSGIGIPPSGTRLTEPLCLCGPGLSKDTTQVHTYFTGTDKEEHHPTRTTPPETWMSWSSQVRNRCTKGLSRFGIRPSESSRASGSPDTHWSDLDFNLGFPKVFLLHQSLGRRKSIWGTALFFGSGCGSLGILNMLLS